MFFSQLSGIPRVQTLSTRCDEGYVGPQRWECEIIIYSPREGTNRCLQNGSVASLPSQEQEEMASSHTQEVPGKGPLAPLEGRCGAVTLSAVLVLGESSSVCPWLYGQLFQECHVNLSYFRAVRNPQESKPFAGPAWLFSLCAVRQVLPLRPLPQPGPSSGTPKPAAHLCREPGSRGRQSSVRCWA